MSTGPRRSILLAHEAAVAHGPYELRAWLEYLSALPEGTARFPVYERAVAALPGSYKLWLAYLREWESYAARFHPAHRARRARVDCAWRAARAVLRSPVLWEEVIGALGSTGRFGEMRAALGEALKALPVSQHDRVWAVAIAAVDGKGLHVLLVGLLKRFAKLQPADGEAVWRLWEAMLGARMWDEAVGVLVRALVDQAWVPPSGATRESVWIKVARVTAQHADVVRSVDVPAEIAKAARAATTEVAETWAAFAEYYIRQGLFEKARAVYEEAVTTVVTVRDFALVFDAFAKFEESLATAAMEDVEAITAEGAELDESTEKAEADAHAAELKDAEEAVELHIARLEFLTNRRPMLLSDVWLRQNPHNVHEWHKRARLFKIANDAAGAVATYTMAVKTVDPWCASNGRPHTLWLAFARYYEDADDWPSARRVLDKAVNNPELFRSAEDMAAVWCEYAEMELRCGAPASAREVLLRATTQPPKMRLREVRRKSGASKSNAVAAVGAGAGNVTITHAYDNSTLSPAWDTYKSIRVWCFLVDLTESICDPDEVIRVYHAMLDHGIATSQTVINAAAFLESKRLFEQAFRIYDRGTSVVPWPDALAVWVVYLAKFVKRFGGSKLERARDLFEEAIKAAPTTRKSKRTIPNPQIRVLYVMYANMEEQYSLARHAMAVYARAATAVPDTERADMYRVYIVKLASLFGVTKTRPVYEEALTNLNEREEVLEFAQRYAMMETRLGEIDRARAIYAHSAQVANPRGGTVCTAFWKVWHDFELAHGSQDTFRDMLRVKRAVEMRHADSNLAASIAANGNGASAVDASSHPGESAVDGNVAAGEANGSVPGLGAMAALELQAAAGAAKGSGDEDRRGNDEEIDLDLDEDNSDGDDTDEDGKGGGGSEQERDQGSRDEDLVVPARIQSLDNNRKSEKLDIVQKELPAAVRSLAGVDAEESGQDEKHKTDANGVGGGPDSSIVEDTALAPDTKAPMGALERIKRRR